MPYVRTNGQFTVTGNERCSSMPARLIAFSIKAKTFYLHYDKLSDRTVLKKQGCQLEAMAQYHTSNWFIPFRFGVSVFTMSKQCEELSCSSDSLMISKMQVTVLFQQHI